MEKVDGWNPVKEFFKCPICGREFDDHDDAVGCRTSHPKVVSVVGWDDWQEVLPATIYVKMSDGRMLRYGYCCEETKRAVLPPFAGQVLGGSWR